MQWKSCTLCIIRHEGLQLCFGWLNWWIESLQSLVTLGFPMAKFVKTPSIHACYLGDILQVKSIQRILQDPLEMVQPSDPSISRSISLDVCRAARHQLPRLTCDRWGTQDLGSKIVIPSYFWGMKINQTSASLVRTAARAFPYSNKDCLVSDHSINSGFLGACGHCTCLYPPFEISVCLWPTLWKLHCQFLGGGVTARTLVVERTLQQ